MATLILNAPRKLRNVIRVDVVFDQYLPDSLKETARQKVRKRVSGEIKIPSNWQAFLRIDGNTTELFHFFFY